jgi:hypothetical protein
MTPSQATTELQLHGAASGHETDALFLIFALVRLMNCFLCKPDTDFRNKALPKSPPT